MMRVFTLVALGATAVTAQDVSDLSMTLGAGQADRSGTLDGSNTMAAIDRGNPFPVDGTLDSWSFWVGSSSGGDLYLQVFSHVGDRQYMLQGEQLVDAATARPNANGVMTVPADFDTEFGHNLVRGGWVFGLAYKTAAATIPMRGGGGWIFLDGLPALCSSVGSTCNFNSGPRTYSLEVGFTAFPRCTALDTPQGCNAQACTATDTPYAGCVWTDGCTDEIAENYDPSANRDDSSCTYIMGCTDTGAVNYDAAATRDDDSCVCAGFRFMRHGPRGAHAVCHNCLTCNGDMNGDMKVNTADILLLLGDFNLCDPRLISDGNNDSCVDVQDLMLMLELFGTDCTSPSTDICLAGKAADGVCPGPWIKLYEHSESGNGLSAAQWNNHCDAGPTVPPTDFVLWVKMVSSVCCEESLAARCAVCSD